MLFQAFVFFQLFLLGFSQSSTCSDSEVSAMSQCWLNYVGEYGFASIPSFNDYINKYIGYLQGQGPKGMSTICSWINDKDSCETPYKADCHDVQSYKKILNTDDSMNAGNYFTGEAINVWECGAGYNSKFLNMIHNEIFIHLRIFLNCLK